jgi:hypothetical protein
MHVVLCLLGTLIRRWTNTRFRRSSPQPRSYASRTDLGRIQTLGRTAKCTEELENTLLKGKGELVLHREFLGKCILLSLSMPTLQPSNLTSHHACPTCIPSLPCYSGCPIRDYHTRFRTSTCHINKCIHCRTRTYTNDSHRDIPTGNYYPRSVAMCYKELFRLSRAAFAYWLSPRRVL